MLILLRSCAVLAASIAVLLLACGGGGSDEQEIADTFEGFFEALGRDTAEAYAYLAQECTDQVDFSDFALRNELATFLAGNEIDVRNVEIVERDGNEVTVDFDVVLLTEGVDPQSLEPSTPGLGRARVVKEGDRWRLADCENFMPPDDPGAEVSAKPTPLMLSRAAGQLAEAGHVHAQRCLGRSRTPRSDRGVLPFGACAA